MLRAGVTCPACHQFCYERSDGNLSEHKTANYVLGQRMGGRLRERCPYSGGTWQDAKDHITPFRRWRMDREASLASECSASRESHMCGLQVNHSTVHRCGACDAQWSDI